MNKAEVSKRIVTPATVLSGLRPILAVMAVYHLSKGKVKLAAAEATVSAITDYADGKLARGIEPYFPGWGVTETGAQADQGADTAALAILGVGMVISKRAHPLARAASALVTAHEGYKVRRAAIMSADYQARTQTKGFPQIPSSKIGKISIGLKQAAEAGAVVTALDSLIERPAARLKVAATSFGAAVGGVIFAEVAGMGYETYYQEKVIPTLPQLSEPESIPLVPSAIDMPPLA
jgi:phosphatidylglycerophosphate synthase